MVQSGYESTLKTHSALGRQGIVVGEPYGAFGYHTWQISDPLFELRSKLACLFPRRVLLFTEKFIFNEDDGSYWIPVDFLIHAISMSALIRRQYAYLLPKRIRIERDSTGLNENVVSAYGYREKEEFISIPSSGSGIEELQAQKRNFDQPFDFLLNLPWLLTTDVRHCVDIMEKYSTEFTIYSNAVTSALSAQDPESLQKWILEVLTSSQAIDVIYANRMKELRAKGWETLIGFLPSMLAFALPDSDVKAVLAPVVASKTIADGARWLFDIHQAKDRISNEKHWIVWRMKR
ncbi:MAG: hypothetical protein JWR26_3055 [Pedosphaera sp.]|nr:hypothetical protein [Pedosphaera sp.]